MTKILFTVTTDISYDQRMDRICTSLNSAGYHVEIVGRHLKHSKSITGKPYNSTRFKNIFTVGKLFYIEHNIRLFFFLLFRKYDILCAIDLDTIIPGYCVSKWRRKSFVYDAHEYFPEQTQITKRPSIKRFWTKIESTIVPKLKYAYTVNQSLSNLFEQKYGTSFSVIRNAARHDEFEPVPSQGYLIYAGWVDPHRGLEELIEAAPKLKTPIMICGEGTLLSKLQKQVEKADIRDRVIFKGLVEPKILKTLIKRAFIGINLIEDHGLSYRYSLANKFFDYMQCEIPQLCSDLPEYRRINDEFGFASLITEISVEEIVTKINHLVENTGKYQELKINTRLAKKELCWEKEEEKLINFYRQIKQP